MPMHAVYPASLSLLLLLLALLVTPAVATPERHALVIGNAAYVGERPLTNTLNDARDMAARLRELGFEVTAQEDLGVRAMRRRINRFLADVRGRGGVVLLYFSGHGVQDSDRRSYLLPVDAVIEREADMKTEGVWVNGMLDELARRPDGAVSLVILDACRDNPFASGRGGKGLGRVTPLGGILVLYAASPGQTADDNPRGRNGLFTQHRHRPRPGHRTRRCGKPRSACSVPNATGFSGR